MPHHRHHQDSLHISRVRHRSGQWHVEFAAENKYSAIDGCLRLKALKLRVWIKFRWSPERAGQFGGADQNGSRDMRGHLANRWTDRVLQRMARDSIISGLDNNTAARILKPAIFDSPLIKKLLCRFKLLRSVP